MSDKISGSAREAVIDYSDLLKRLAEWDAHGREQARLCGFKDYVYGRTVREVAAAITALQAEADAARAWKESALAVEASWDVQAIARLIGAPLGPDIRAAIQPAIERLKAERDDLAMVLIRLIYRYGRGLPLDEALGSATDYLERKQLNGSPLRDAGSRDD
jgi:hypothetical protein